MNAGDTICAIATPPGEGGIGIIRLSGEKALDIASTVFAGSGGRTVREYKTHTLHHGELRAPDTGVRIDEVLVAVMKAPRSYTREDVVEFHCHGGPLVLRLGLEVLIRSGARLAEPGEFTKRAFLNGRLDLAQAEAVMDLIQARTQTGLRVALEQLRGALSDELGRIREGLTRLLVEVGRTHDALARAELVLVVLDGSAPIDPEDRRTLEQLQEKSAVLVVNKADLPPRVEPTDFKGFAELRRIVWTSATTGAGLDELRDAIRDTVLTQGLEPSEGVLITHLRHRSALERAKTSLDQARVSVRRHMAAECIAADLRVAINAIGEIIGETTTDDILDRIFKEFCIGK